MGKESRVTIPIRYPGMKISPYVPVYRVPKLTSIKAEWSGQDLPHNHGTGGGVDAFSKFTIRVGLNTPPSQDYILGYLKDHFNADDRIELLTDDVRVTTFDIYREVILYVRVISLKDSMGDIC